MGLQCITIDIASQCFKFKTGLQNIESMMRMLLHENPWDEESQVEWDRRVAEMVSRTERRLTKYKLG